MPPIPLPRTSISILEARIRLLSIPRHAIREQMFSVARCLAFRHQLAAERGSDPFFNLTFNEIELSLFADTELVEKVFGSHQDPANSSSSPSVEISEDVWVPLQVEQHDDDSWEKSGGRVRDISAPLAAEGISIMFLSTYISDFLLIKQHRLELVIEILQQEGFYCHDADDISSSLRDLGSPTSPLPAMTPLPSTPGSSLQSQLPRSLTGSILLSTGDRHDSSSGTRMQRTGSGDSSVGSPRRRHEKDGTSSTSSSLSETRPSNASRRNTGESSDVFEHSPLAPPLPSLAGGSHANIEDESSPAPSYSESRPRSYDKMQESMLSDSTTASGIVDKISLLPDELVCVGLSMAHEQTWRTKLMHALYYHEDIMPRRASHMIRTSSHMRKGNGDDDGWGASQLIHSRSSIPGKRSLYSTTPTPSRPITTRLTSNRSSRSPSPDRDAETYADTIATTAEADYPTPFLSLSLTVEGGSLIADIRLLRALFKGEDESMVYANGQGGLSDLWSGEQDDYSDLCASLSLNDAPRGRSQSEVADESAMWENLDVEDVSASQEDDVTNELEQQGRRLFKCLQLDLSSFGLEKAGLASQFADLLVGEEINLLYSSTFRTANILVAKRHIRQARAALESATKS